MFHMLLITLMFITSSIFANSELAISSDPNALADQIMLEQPDSIDHYADGKIYLKPERINVTNEGLFLVKGESSIPLRMLMADRRGCFIGSTQLAIYRCTNPHCQTVWIAHTGPKCPKCGSPGTIAH